MLYTYILRLFLEAKNRKKWNFYVKNGILKTIQKK